MHKNEFLTYFSGQRRRHKMLLEEIMKFMAILYLYRNEFSTTSLAFPMADNESLPRPTSPPWYLVDAGSCCRSVGTICSTVETITARIFAKIVTKSNWLRLLMWLGLGEHVKLSMEHIIVEQVGAQDFLNMFDIREFDVAASHEGAMWRWRKMLQERLMKRHWGIQNTARTYEIEIHARVHQCSCARGMGSLLTSLQDFQ